MRIDEARTLNPGLLRHRITYQRKVISGQDAIGQDLYTWVDLASVSAQIKAVTGREKQSADQRWAEAQYRITQHWYAGLQRGDRIAWWSDGEMRYLDVIDIEDQAGTQRVQFVLAKEWTE